MRSLEDEAGIYGGELATFAYHYKLPLKLFAIPDHIVIRAANIDSFARLFRDEVAPRANQAVCVETEPRIKVAAKLSGQLAVYDIGYVRWLEMDEPRVEQSDSSIQRAEFYSDSLERTMAILRARRIPLHLRSDDYRDYVDVQVPGSGLEFRFTNVPLSVITNTRLSSDRAIQIGLGKRPNATGPPTETV